MSRMNHYVRSVKHQPSTGRLLNVGRIEQPEDIFKRKTEHPYESRKENYEDLANAIVKSAASDYRMTYKRYIRMINQNKTNTSEFVNCKFNLKGKEKFFYSGYFKLLTKVDGEYIVKRIQAEVKEEMNYTKGDE